MLGHIKQQMCEVTEENFQQKMSKITPEQLKQILLQMIPENKKPQILKMTPEQINQWKLKITPEELKQWSQMTPEQIEQSILQLKSEPMRQDILETPLDLDQLKYQIPPKQFEFQSHLNQVSLEIHHDLVKSQPADLLQALGVLQPNFELLKQEMSNSEFKTTLDTTKWEDMNYSAECLDDMKNKFDVTRLMICAMFGYTPKGLKMIFEGANVNIQNSLGLTALMFAAMFQCVDSVQMLIEKGADVNLKSVGQINALKWAVLQGNEEIVKVLLDNKADVHARTASGIDALHIAAEKGFDDIVHMLIEKGVNVSSKSLDGWTPLMRSVRFQDSTITKLILQKKPNVNDINSEGNTALHISVMYLTTSSTSRLIKHGADVNSTNSLGMTPLMYAVNIEDNLEIVQEILDKGATETINSENNIQRTALFYAICNKRKDIVNKLISSGAKTEIYDVAGSSPIVYACKNKLNDIVNKLLQLKEESWYKHEELLLCLHYSVENNDLPTTKCLLKFRQKPKILSELKLALKRYVSPLFAAANHKSQAMLKLLLDAGADVNTINTDFQTILMFSILLNENKIAKHLVETYRADVNLKDKNGDTALTLAAATNNKTMVDFLLKKNAAREITNNQGVSAMMLASSLGNCDMVRSLYGQGYNLELCDSEGWTPLMFSTSSGDAQTVKFLLVKGAKVNVFSKGLATPLMIASANGKNEAVSLLLELGASVNERDCLGQTALIHAAINGQKIILELLLKNEQTDCNLGDIFKKTALIYSVIRGDLENMKLLLQYKANCSQGDIYGNTPFMLSACRGFIEGMKTLLDLKVEVNESKVDGNTALHFASNNGHKDAVSLLLQHVANPDKTNLNGDTSLMLAAANGHDSVVQCLLSSPGVDVNLQNSEDGKCALIVAVAYNKQTIVRLLVLAGADVNASIKTGETAIHLSVMKGCVEAVNYLITAPNINLNTETDLGYTPLIYSIHYERFDLVRSFILAGAEVKKVTKLKVDAISYSIERKSVSALKIILENCKLSRKEKERYHEIAKKSGCTAQILDLIQQAKICEEVQADTGTQNVTVECLTETERNSQWTLSSSTKVNLDGVEIRIETASSQMDNASERCNNISIPGNSHNTTFNFNVRKTKTCIIGDNNVVLERKSGQT